MDRTPELLAATVAVERNYRNAMAILDRHADRIAALETALNDQNRLIEQLALIVIRNEESQ